MITRPKPTAAPGAQALLAIQRDRTAVGAAVNPAGFRKRLLMHRENPDLGYNKDWAWVVLKAPCLQLQQGPSLFSTTQ